MWKTTMQHFRNLDPLLVCAGVQLFCTLFLQINQHIHYIHLWAIPQTFSHYVCTNINILFLFIYSPVTLCDVLEVSFSDLIPAVTATLFHSFLLLVIGSFNNVLSWSMTTFTSIFSELKSWDLSIISPSVVVVNIGEKFPFIDTMTFCLTCLLSPLFFHLIFFFWIFNLEQSTSDTVLLKDSLMLESNSVS